MNTTDKKKETTLQELELFHLLGRIEAKAESLNYEGNR